MIFRENRLLADDSHEISFLIFVQKLGKMSQNLSSVAVVIDALRVKGPGARILFQGFVPGNAPTSLFSYSD